MQTLRITEGIDTPHVDLNGNGKMRFSGKSYPEDIHKFYDQIFEWLHGYFETTDNTQTVFDFDFTYLNSVSSKALFDLFSLCEKFSASHTFIINWHYNKENNLSKELGEEFQQEFPIFTFSLISS